MAASDVDDLLSDWDLELEVLDERRAFADGDRAEAVAAVHAPA
ncbi:hypothetical protein [Agromyces allii]|uniref:Uncharacterized protein n=1 Tax=Agromyces allii TaxID=393607 RepID=A0ABN2R3E8_9MICO|nr:hypothetical protein [Agromyces allii]